MGKDQGLALDTLGFEASKRKAQKSWETHKQHPHTEPAFTFRKAFHVSSCLILRSEVSFSLPSNQNIFLVVLPPHVGPKPLILSAKNAGSLHSSLPN